MLGIYLLVTLFTQLAPQNLVALTSGDSRALPVRPVSAPVVDVAQGSATLVGSIEETQPVRIVVNFDNAIGLREGLPVFLDGKVVGTVAELEEGDLALVKTVCSAGNCSTVSPRQVELKIQSADLANIRSGAVALVTQPAVSGGSNSKQQTTVIEILVPEAGDPIAPGEMIAGYTSFEKFWLSGSDRPARS
jgi:hypothetical protein